jgi:hypothetical protein
MEDVRPELRRFVAEDFAAPTWDPWAALSLLVEICDSLGDGTSAHRLIDRLTPYAAYHVIAAEVNVSLGPASRYLGILHRLRGEWGAAERRFQEARDRSRAMGWTLWERYAELDEAKLRLLRRGPGDRERGRELASRVLADARARALARLARHAEAVLAGASDGRSRPHAV